MEVDTAKYVADIKRMRIVSHRKDRLGGLKAGEKVRREALESFAKVVRRAIVGWRFGRSPREELVERLIGLVECDSDAVCAKLDKGDGEELVVLENEARKEQGKLHLTPGVCRRLVLEMDRLRKDHSTAAGQVSWRLHAVLWRLLENVPPHGASLRALRVAGLEVD